MADTASPSHDGAPVSKTELKRQKFQQRAKYLKSVNHQQQSVQLVTNQQSGQHQSTQHGDTGAQVDDLDATDARSINYLGAVALFFLATVSLKVAIDVSPHAPFFVAFPFVATVVGATVGFYAEAIGVSVRNFPSVVAFRQANLGFVHPSFMFFFLCCSEETFKDYAVHLVLTTGLMGLFFTHAGFGSQPWFTKMLIYGTIFLQFLAIFNATSPVMDEFLDDAVVPAQLHLLVGDSTITHRTALYLGWGFVLLATLVGDLIIAGAASMKWFSPVFHSLLTIGVYVWSLPTQSSNMLGWWTFASSSQWSEQVPYTNTTLLNTLQVPLPPHSSTTEDVQLLLGGAAYYIVSAVSSALCSLGNLLIGYSSAKLCSDAYAGAIIGEENVSYTINAVSELVNNMAMPLLAFATMSLMNIVLLPFHYSQLRYTINGSMWSLIHRFLLAVPAPEPPAAKRRVPDPESIGFVAYWRRHDFARCLGLPASTSIPVGQRANYLLLTVVFKIISWLDRFMPTARNWSPPQDKPRVSADQGIEYYWPTRTINKPPPLAPSYVRTFRENPGRLLSWQLTYGAGDRELINRSNIPESCNNGKNVVNEALFAEADEVANKYNAPGAEPIVTTHCLDLRRMEKYEYKQGFAPYGGLAFFVAVPDTNPAARTTVPPGWVNPNATEGKDVPFRLQLAVMYRAGDVHRAAPLAMHNVRDSRREEFIQVERQLSASLVCLTVVIYHLLEIHCMTALFATTFHNTFDVITDEVYPLRAILQFHYFNSTAVQELTTPHLLDSTAVFSQVFAFEFQSMTTFVDDEYANYKFLNGTDLEDRNDNFSSSALQWERVYHEQVFMPYADKIVETIWGSNDARVAADPSLQALYVNLSSQLPGRGLGDRHEKLETAAGVSRFLADLIYFVTVRHEILGTLVPLAVLDHRFTGGSQQVEDGSPLPLEEYLSLMTIAASTGMKKFPQFMKMPGRASVEEVFSRNLRSYLGGAAAEQGARSGDGSTQEISDAFEGLVTRLRELQDAWSTRFEDSYNRNYIRAQPKDLEIAAGY